MSKLRSFVKKESVETQTKRSSSDTRLKSIHKKRPEGIILYKNEKKIVEACNYIIASRKYKDKPFSVEINKVTQEINVSNINKPNIDYLALFLSEAIDSKVSVKELLLLYEKKSNNAVIHLYPGMITRIHGYIKENIDQNALTLGYDGKEVVINLSGENNLQKESRFISNRFVFIIGSIDSIEEGLSVTALAVLT